MKMMNAISATGWGSRLRHVVAIGVSCLVASSVPGSTAAAGDQLEELVAALQSPNPAMRARAAMKLADVKSTSATTVSALTVVVLDQNLNVRYWAATALTAIGPAAERAVPALIEALKTFPGGTPPLDGPPRYYADVRVVAAQALGAIGPAAMAALTALRNAAADPDPVVRSAVAEAVRRIEPPPDHHAVLVLVAPSLWRVG